MHHRSNRRACAEKDLTSRATDFCVEVQTGFQTGLFQGAALEELAKEYTKLVGRGVKRIPPMCLLPVEFDQATRGIGVGGYEVTTFFHTRERTLASVAYLF